MPSPLVARVVLAFSIVLLGAATGLAEVAVATPDGFATQGDGVTGGGDAEPVTVSSAAELQKAVAGDSPAVVVVEGKIAIDGVDIGANKTLIGAGPDAALAGGTLRIGSNNVIVQNLTVGPVRGDAIEISGAKNVLVTKCDLHDSSDELCSIVRQSDFVTVSWCKFYFDDTHSHAFGGLIGNRDDRTSDRGKLHVTMHHNWYAQGVRGRMPRVRYGSVHIYNNYYGCPDSLYCIGTGFECHVRVENSCFDGVKTPWRDQRVGATESGGEIGWDNLLFEGSEQPTYIENSYPVFDPPYSYHMEGVDEVKAVVTDPEHGAGNRASR
ncbi:Pectate trisaccharide-lyase precursor [Pseudobythopirellula maris]|uniref:Pectate trisaccharide-lyase n=1 Tax=Pseudobythopirellula maris TaxID=2527991 RepID=A0A5C5ZND4_9BACT|nr:hypothetical protein [Pseudobythopirellula maris]TWT88351.1 Pectate trisaccharide-lyase precursor [Pseudobythopirellula maris]